MARFITRLRVALLDDRKNEGRGAWELVAALVYESDVAASTITVPKGFRTDYASVPRVPIAFMLTGDTAHSAAVVHDWLYSTHEVERAIADQVLYEAAIVSKVPAWRARIMYAAVRLFGGSHWSK